MSHLRKKITNYLWGDNIQIWCDFIPIINKNCLMFYEFEKGERKFLFYYLYDKTKNLKENITAIKERAVKYANYYEIENCKKAINYMKKEEYENCKINCRYSIYCKQKEKTQDFLIKFIKIKAGDENDKN